MATVQLRIRRFDPATDAAARWDDFAVDAREHDSLLDCLMRIVQEQDPTLGFRRSCRSGICGTCAMRVNGRATLVCERRALAHAGDVIMIEPLAALPVLRDLIVDMDAFYADLQRITPWLIEHPAISAPQDGHVIQEGDVYHAIRDVDVCVLCAACHSDVHREPGDANRPGPIAAVKALRFILDERDHHEDRAARIRALDVLWGQDADGADLVCPKGVPLGSALLTRYPAPEE